MHQSDFRDEIQNRTLIADGDMGTALYGRGVFINQCYDELNLSRPDLVQDIHREYFNAGAEILRTNTYGANPVRLGGFGHEGKVAEINERGAILAREAGRGQTYVAGTIGRLTRENGQNLGMTPAEMQAAYAAQVAGLLAGKVDLFIVQSIPHEFEARAAVGALKAATDKPIVLLLALDDSSTDWYQRTPAELLDFFEEMEVDMGGVEGFPSPEVLLDTVTALCEPGRLPIGAIPAAGIPRLVEGRSLFMASPEYFAKFSRRFFRAGVKLFGTGAGTTPEFLRDVSAMIRSLQPTRVAQNISVQERAEEEGALGMEPVPKNEKSDFARKVGEEFTYVVEIDPPRGLNPTKAIEGARMLKEHGISCINIADGPRATARMNPIYLGKLIQDEVGIETLVHFCTRDRNVLALQADLLGMHALGMHNVLAITGDPPKLGDYPFVSAVYDIDSVGLLGMVNQLNRGRDFGGKELKQQTKFFVGCGCDPGSTNLDEEVRRVHRKIAAGTEFIMTQPVYDTTVIDRFAERIKEVTVPILIGILPLYSYRNAEFLHNEIPGMSVPQAIRDRLKAAPSAEDARNIGVEVAAEALLHAKSLPQVKGVYLMPPFGKYHLAVDILQKADML